VRPFVFVISLVCLSNPATAADDSGSPALIIEQLRTLCDADDAEGCLKLGGVLALYPEHAKNGETIEELSLRACQLGATKGCALAGPYFEARGGKENLNRAFELYTQGCEGGYATGCAVLGTLLLSYPAPGGDPAAALAAYERACAAGEGLGCGGVARIFTEGIGVPADPGKALELNEQGCGLDDAHSCYNAGQGYAFPKGGGETNYPVAAYYFNSACKLGLQPGCTNTNAITSQGIMPAAP